MFEIIENESELQPWVVVYDHESSVATWQLQNSEDIAVTIFTTQDKAASYAEECTGGEPVVRQLDHLGLVRLFAKCYQEKIRFAALDPTQSDVRKVFKIADVLKAARNSLTRQ